MTILNVSVSVETKKFPRFYQDNEDRNYPLMLAVVGGKLLVFRYFSLTAADIDIGVLKLH